MKKGSVCVTHHNVDLKEAVKYFYGNQMRVSQMQIALLKTKSTNKSMQSQF